MAAADPSAVRVALWRALHVQIDPPPHVIEDEVGLQLAAPVFPPAEILATARDAGFRKAEHVSASALAERYFAGRADGLRPPSHPEELLVAGT